MLVQAVASGFTYLSSCSLYIPVTLHTDVFSHSRDQLLSKYLKIEVTDDAEEQLCCHRLNIARFLSRLKLCGTSSFSFEFERLDRECTGIVQCELIVEDEGIERGLEAMAQLLNISKVSHVPKKSITIDDRLRSTAILGIPVAIFVQSVQVLGISNSLADVRMQLEIVEDGCATSSGCMKQTVAMAQLTPGIATIDSVELHAPLQASLRLSIQATRSFADLNGVAVITVGSLCIPLRQYLKDSETYARVSGTFKGVARLSNCAPDLSVSFSLSYVKSNNMKVLAFDTNLPQLHRGQVMLKVHVLRCWGQDWDEIAQHTTARLLIKCGSGCVSQHS